MQLPILAIVIPCYNEQEVLGETIRRLQVLMDGLVRADAIHPASRVWFVDDGSRDGTWPIVWEATSTLGSRFVGIKLSRNCGHQVALLAGLMTAKGDVLISVDADLQDCRRRPNFDHPCRLNIDQGWKPVSVEAGCG